MKISNEVLREYLDSGLSTIIDINAVIATFDAQGNSILSHAPILAPNFHPLFAETVLNYWPLKLHADGIFPYAMIAQRRPSETYEILAYRRQVYKPITKQIISRVLHSLSKIRRSPDWKIEFNSEAKQARIVEEESLENYTSKKIPGFTSITNWAFSILLKQQCIDANAVIAVLPVEPVIDNEFAKPVPILFNSDYVMEYDEVRQFAILKSMRKIRIENNGTTRSGSRFYYIDDVEVIVYDETHDGFNIFSQESHNLGKMPVFKVAAEVHKQYDSTSVNRSRLDGMVAFLDEATCEYSDLKGSKIMNLFPLMWYYQNRDCITCKGTGQIPADPKPINCQVCGGSGKVKFSPFASMAIDEPAIGKAPVPNPPAGFVQRDVAILELQDRSVDKNKYNALAAINMQFLENTPLSISGQAKQVDREELNNFVYNIAEDLVASIDKVYFFINEWRYKFIVPDDVARRAMLPAISVPQHFDLLPQDYLVEQITSGRKVGLNPFLISTLEKELVAKKFYNDPELVETVTLYFDLDPLKGMTVDEKIALKNANGITEEDFIISSYMAQFVNRALHDDPNFSTLPYDEQVAVLVGYAKEKTSVIDAAAALVTKQKLNMIQVQKAASNTQGNSNNQPGNSNNQNNNQQPGGNQHLPGNNLPVK